MLKYEGQTLNQLGQPVASPTVTVYLAGTQTAASLYASDSTSNSTPNPITGDTVGYFSFYVADGVYDISISGSTFTTFIDQSIQIFDGVGTASSADSKWNIYNVSSTILDVPGLASAPALSVNDSGRIYFDSVADTFKISQSGGAFGPLAGSNHNLLSSTHPDTSAASPVLGDIIYANASPLWTKLAGNTSATKKFLTQTGNATISAAPSWAQVDGADVATGLIGLARGGTNVDLSAAGSATNVLAISGSQVVSARDLVAADIPNISGAKITSGLVGLARGGTNVDLSAVGSSTNVLAIDASHVVSARNLVAADIPSLDAGKITTGIITDAQNSIFVKNVNITPVTANTNTTGEQALIIYTTPSGYINTLGKTIRFYASGLFSTTGAPTMRWRVRYDAGGSQIVFAGDTNTPTSGSTNLAWVIDAIFSTTTTGASGVVTGSGIAYTYKAAGVPLVDVDSRVMTAQDITGTVQIYATIAFGTGSTSNTVTQKLLFIERLN